jgi:superfamily II DNA or RNA helicase
VGWLLEEHGDFGAHLVFASVAKLARAPWLERLTAERFDYVVIDEVHHAAADSYRRILGVLDPPFLLGLTATPDRTDAADILGLFDDHVSYRAGIARGIAIARLVPFRYFGIRDDVDYHAENIPWRNGRFDPARLAVAVQTDQRMATLWDAWGRHAGSRTLVFCCSVAHADYTAKWLATRGVRIARVYSAPGSDDRDEALRRLAAGELEAICVVDVFNEGVDVPSLDRVVMLRPTESGVVFLQQLGRGLRATTGKAFLTVIDFVGNHRVFIERLRTLLSLGPEHAAKALRTLVATGEADLPAGCSVTVTVEARAELEALFKVGGADDVERAYRELRAARGARPTAGELYRMGFLLSTLRRRHASWFAWVRSEGDLSDAEVEALARSEGFLEELEAGERMVKSYKMVTLEALIDAGALASGLPIPELALRSWQLLRRSPELLSEVPDNERLSDSPTEAEQLRWVRYWRTNPIHAWTSAKKQQRTWFRLDGDRLVLGLAIDSTMVSLIRELVDYRLAMHRRRTPSMTSEGFSCRVTWNQRDPILKLPDRHKHTLPDGETDVRLPDGSVWIFRLASDFCNVARPAGTELNQLPDLLRRWFGPRAGQPGTTFDVRFVASPDGLWVEPVQSNLLALPARRGIIAYPDLRAAAGHALGEIDAPEAGRVLLPFDGEDSDLFAVRVAGTSMDGGKSPLSDGDWALMRLCRGAPADALINRVALVQVPGTSSGSRYQIKRIARTSTGWRLISDNPEGPSFEATEEMIAIARLDRSLRPEDLAPPVNARIATSELSNAFAIPDLTPATGRHGGHLFHVLGDAVTLVGPDRVKARATLLPGETAYVLAPEEGGVRYLGVGRWLADEGSWGIPEVAFDVWRRFGEGRSASRALPPGALARAGRVTEVLLALPEELRALVQPTGLRARILGRAAKGGLRLATGETERTVSLVDLAWVAVASDDVLAQGGLLDEARVNRLRYLEGTPRASTRWIDTPWALAAWESGAPRVEAIDAASAPHHPRRADGTVVDATFRVEMLGGHPSIVFESRGGTRGTKQAQNTEYAEGLRLILERLAAAGFVLTDAALDTRETRDAPIEARRLDIGQPFPVTIVDAEALRRALGWAQERTGKAPGGKGGNATRRIRLWVGGAHVPTPMVLTTLLESSARR